jgi:hydrogenase expression/formation protein HypC
MCLSIPGQVVNVGGEGPHFLKGQVSFSGVLKEVSFAYVPEVKVGDYVLVHVGFALGIIDEEKANNVFKTLEELKEFHAEEDSRENSKEATKDDAKVNVKGTRP